jgi:DNA-binding winged helix-turn-helix (wHTH) protein
VERVRFEDAGLTLDLETGALDGGDAEGALTPLSLRLLGHLVHNHDRVVPKEELLREVWEGVRVSDDSLRQALRVLRRELGERGAALVETVRGRGYRLAAPAVPADPEVRGDRLLGRDEEIASLLEDLEAARDGGGRLTLIAGPPGIGKTRLIEELGRLAARRGFAVAVARCEDAEVSPPLWPWEQILRDLVRRDAGLVDRLAAPDRRALERTFPSLREAGGGAEDPGASDLEPGAARSRLFEAVRGALLAASSVRPLALALDDIQRADAASHRLLEWLEARRGAVPIALIAAYRDALPTPSEEVLAAMARLHRGSSVRDLALAPLSREAVGEAVHLRISDAAAATVESVWRESSGNPFLLRIALDRHSAGRQRAPLGVGARAAVLGQLAMIPEPERHVLAVAAVMGMEVRASLVATFVDAPATLAAALEAACHAGLLRERPDGSFAFVHALVVEALYESLAADRREQIHASLAERLASQAEVDSGEIAEHAFRGRAALDPEWVTRCCERAARDAADRLGYESAAHWLERALACTEEASPRVRLDLLVQLVEARAKSAGAPGAEPVTDRAVALAREIGDDGAHARALLAFAKARGPSSDVIDARWRGRVEQALAEHTVPTRERAVLLSLFAETLWITPEIEYARALVRESLELVEGVADHDVRIGVLLRAFRILQTGRGDDELRVDLAARIAETLPRVRDRLEVLESCMYSQWEGLVTGDRSAVVRWSEALVRDAEATGGPHARWWSSVSKATRSLLEGRLDEAEGHAERGRTIGLEAGIEAAMPNYLLQLLSLRWPQGRVVELEPLLEMGAGRGPRIMGWDTAWRMAQLHAGRAGPARALMEELLESDLRLLGADLSYSALLAMLTDMSERLGDRAMAEALRPRLAEMTHRHATVALGFCHWGSLVGYLGRVELLLGDLAAAASHLEAGIERDRALGDRACVARGQLALAAALAARDGPGDAARARELQRRGSRLARQLGIVAPAFGVGGSASRLRAEGAGARRQRARAPVRRASSGAGTTRDD